MSNQAIQESNIIETAVQDNLTQEPESKPVQVFYQNQVADEELHKLLLPDVRDLPLAPPSSIETNFVSYVAPGSVLALFSCLVLNCSLCISLKQIVLMFPFMNFVSDFIKPGHDQYVYRHANGYVF